MTNLYSVPLTFDVPGAGLDQGRWTDAKLASALKGNLDRKGKKRNNIQDALIAETAITNTFTLVTCDDALRHVAEAYGCQVFFFEKERSRANFVRTGERIADTHLCGQ